VNNEKGYDRTSAYLYLLDISKIIDTRDPFYCLFRSTGTCILIQP